jgi:hypothetical protein
MNGGGNDPNRRVTMRALVLSVSLLALAACGKTASPSVSANVAAQAAAKCAGWPAAVIQKTKLTWKQPDKGPAPYLDFPEARQIFVDAKGICQSNTPTRVISLTPMHHLNGHSMVAMGDYQKGRVWMMILMDENDGGRTFYVMDGTPADNMPFEEPKVLQSPPTSVPIDPANMT